MPDLSPIPPLLPFFEKKKKEKKGFLERGLPGHPCLRAEDITGQDRGGEGGGEKKAAFFPSSLNFCEAKKFKE